jgi:hypothetical protein
VAHTQQRQQHQNRVEQLHQFVANLQQSYFQQQQNSIQHLSPQQDNSTYPTVLSPHTILQQQQQQPGSPSQDSQQQITSSWSPARMEEFRKQHALQEAYRHQQAQLAQARAQSQADQSGQLEVGQRDYGGQDGQSGQGGSG